MKCNPVTDLAIAGILAAAFANFEARAQIVFPATDLPTIIGSYERAYATTGVVDVAGRLGHAGGPQRWDFSEASSPQEFIRRFDIVSPNDGGHGGSFPNATYAARLTTERTGEKSWSYYRLTAGTGRAFYGFYDEQANPTKPATAFDSPTIDLPDPVRFGQTWSRMADWVDLIDAGFFQLNVEVHFTAQAEVDAWGTLALPGPGELATLRVNELHRYQFTDLTLGLPLSDQYFRYYYWLVPGIGPAVEILSSGETIPPPSALSTAADVQRIFLVRPWAASNLRLGIQNGQARLDWRLESEAGGYSVEAKASVTGTNWGVLAEPSVNSWTEPVTTDSARFYRVLVKP